MLCGVPYDLYWYGDPYACVAYREMYRQQIEQRNREMWLQGLYIHDAVFVAINNAFSDKKAKYLQKPFEILKPTEEEEQKRIEETRKKLVEKLNAFKAAFDKMHKQTEAK